MAKKKAEKAFDELLPAGMRDFLKTVQEMEKKGKRELIKAGVEEGPCGSKISYKYRVKSMSGREMSPRPAKADPKKPLLDVFDKGNHILVVISIPGVKKKDLGKPKLFKNTLKISAKTKKGRLERHIPIPKTLKAGKVKEFSFKNGILEIKIKKRGGR